MQIKGTQLFCKILSQSQDLDLSRRDLTEASLFMLRKFLKQWNFDPIFHQFTCKTEACAWWIIAYTNEYLTNKASMLPVLLQYEYDPEHTRFLVQTQAIATCKWRVMIVNHPAERKRTTGVLQIGCGQVKLKIYKSMEVREAGSTAWKSTNIPAVGRCISGNSLQ